LIEAKSGELLSMSLDRTHVFDPLLCRRDVSDDVVGFHQFIQDPSVFGLFREFLSLFSEQSDVFCLLPPCLFFRVIVLKIRPDKKLHAYRAFIGVCEH
jgi:hypothetical protein